MRYDAPDFTSLHFIALFNLQVILNQHPTDDQAIKRYGSCTKPRTVQERHGGTPDFSAIARNISTPEVKNLLLSFPPFTADERVMNPQQKLLGQRQEYQPLQTPDCSGETTLDYRDFYHMVVHISTWREQFFPSRSPAAPIPANECIARLK
jgi:hypothetical protein